MFETKRKISIMEAYTQGAEIEKTIKHRDIWSHTIVPVWDWQGNDYRVKDPTPPYRRK